MRIHGHLYLNAHMHLGTSTHKYFVTVCSSRAQVGLRLPAIFLLFANARITGYRFASRFKKKSVSAAEARSSLWEPVYVYILNC